MNLKLKFPAKKTQVQESFFGMFFFENWRFEKHITLSEKKPPLVMSEFSRLRVRVRVFESEVPIDVHYNNKLIKLCDLSIGS